MENETVTKERPAPPQDGKPRDLNVKIKQKELENFYLISTISVSISVVVIILVSQIFTRKIFKRIIRPVDALMEANERVKKGSYDKLVEYKGEYEFEQLCESFNNMQLTLKEERERDIKWQKTILTQVSLKMEKDLIFLEIKRTLIQIILMLTSYLKDQADKLILNHKICTIFVSML